jgi:hypothetical protein
VSEEGFARGRCRNKRDSWGEQKDTPATKRKPNEKPEGCEYSKKTHMSDLLQQNVQIDRGALADILPIGLQKGLGGTPTFIPQHA